MTTLLLAAGFLLNCAGPFFCLGSDWAWEYGFSAGPGEAQSLVINATYILQVMPPLVGLLPSARACIGSECLVYSCALDGLRAGVAGIVRAGADGEHAVLGAADEGRSVSQPAT